jgi:hypothetical protein
MKLICIRILLLSCFLYICIMPIHAQDKLKTEFSAQEILARVDKMLDYPKGRITGKMIHVTPDGSSRFINIWGAVAGEDILFKFSSADRGEEVKLLYNHKGQNIWVYDLHANKLFNKRELDKFDYVMLTNYCFFDLSHGTLENNYTAKLTGKTSIKGNDCYQLILEPVLSGGIYGLLELYVTTKDFIPIRIDFHDNEKIIFKTMSIVKTALRNEKITPVRYDMLDIKKRTVTMLEFFNFEENIKFEKKIFMHENLWEN